MYEIRNLLGNSVGSRLYLNEKDSDVSICVKSDGHDWHFPAHSLVLRSMSDVFRTMLDTDMLEKTNGRIIIKDYSPLTVKQFLKYLYLGIMEINGWGEAANLLKISHKYEVTVLVQLSENYLAANISFVNVCVLHEIAHTYNLETLITTTTNFIMDSAFIVTFTEGFFTINSKSLDHFLSSPSFNMENESTILSALREWAAVECSRNGYPLTRKNVLSAMEPFFKHIRWNFIPPALRTFVPKEMADKYSERKRRRSPFHFPALLQYHIHILKFIVELGVFYQQKKIETSGLVCLKFSVDSNAFIAGFRIVGLFRLDSELSSAPSSLSLEKEGFNQVIQFNLNSLPWIKGSMVGNYVWKELVAYLPYPVRIFPFCTYHLILKHSTRDCLCTKWPCTRLEVGTINFDLGTVNFNCYSPCYGITQLFMLPAPPLKSVCNDIDS